MRRLTARMAPRSARTAHRRRETPDDAPARSRTPTPIRGSARPATDPGVSRESGPAVARLKTDRGTGVPADGTGSVPVVARTGTDRGIGIVTPSGGSEADDEQAKRAAMRARWAALADSIGEDRDRDRGRAEGPRRRSDRCPRWYRARRRSHAVAAADRDPAATQREWHESRLQAGGADRAVAAGDDVGAASRGYRAAAARADADPQRGSADSVARVPAGDVATHAAADTDSATGDERRHVRARRAGDAGRNPSCCPSSSIAAASRAATCSRT